MEDLKAANPKAYEELSTNPRPAAGFNGLMVGAEEVFRKMANDPDSLTYSDATPITEGKDHEGVTFYAQEVTVRGKNAFGAIVRQRFYVYCKNKEVSINKLSED